ncbi:hypothetical protein L596_027483 [Steinernema carpocapsae]|uniref:Uncharacterized protein n=1 Tax=Steinernema carpocapsae TaxID=34508 RepID=A0A4U5LVL6_STECR|nr:hypothetical protein L596_027483 [Steinernema carpocapsae]
MPSWPVSISFVVLISALSSGCMTTTSSGYSRARMSGVANFVDEPLRAAKCKRADFGSYSAQELRNLATLYPYQSKPELSTDEGGRLSCGFDRPEEYCSWSTNGASGIGFQKARFETIFDIDKFECTSERSFNFGKSLRNPFSDQTMW